MKPDCRIRLAEERDFPIVRKMVWDGLMGLESTVIKHFVFKRQLVQGFILFMSALLSAYASCPVFTFCISYLIGVAIAIGGTHLWLTLYEIGNMAGMNSWEEMKKTYHRFWVAEIKKNNEWILAGSVAYLVLDSAEHPKSVELARVSVTGDARRSGIGQQMLELAAKDALDCGFSKMCVTCWDIRIPAFKLYQKCGFRIIEENIKTEVFGIVRYLDFWMEKKLRKIEED